MQAKKKFSILITTKNRKDDLAFTLLKIHHLLNREDVECLICDDGSNDGTTVFIETNYPKILLIKNSKSKGLIYSRNRLLGLVSAEYAISIDDDLHFITQDPLELIEKKFNENSKIALLGFRIYWSLREPEIIFTDEVSHRMKSFAGGANVWRMEAWRHIPDYPDWFVFYGEEDFASYQLFKKNWEIHYLPEVLVNHRVDLKSQKRIQIIRFDCDVHCVRAGICIFCFIQLNLFQKKSCILFGYNLKQKFSKEILKL